jgi:hypothetical protein
MTLEMHESFIKDFLSKQARAVYLTELQDWLCRERSDTCLMPLTKKSLNQLLDRMVQNHSITRFMDAKRKMPYFSEPDSHSRMCAKILCQGSEADIPASVTSSISAEAPETAQKHEPKNIHGLQTEHLRPSHIIRDYVQRFVDVLSEKIRTQNFGFGRYHDGTPNHSTVVVRVDLTDEEVRAFWPSNNRLADMAFSAIGQHGWVVEHDRRIGRVSLTTTI